MTSNNEWVHRSPRLLLALLVLPTLASPAAAVSTLAFQWEAEDGSLSTITSGDASGLAKGVVVAAADAAGLSFIALTLRFDDEGHDLLDIPPAAELPGDGTPGGQEQTINIPGSPNAFFPYVAGYNRNQIDSTPGNPGLLGSFDFVASGSGLVSATRTLGSVFFRVREVAPEDAALRASVSLIVLDDGHDGISDMMRDDIRGQVQLFGAQVAPRIASVPEAGSGLLLAAGIAALRFASARQDRRR